VILLFVQLTVAATMRHNYAGMAIPTFPYSTPENTWLPAVWDYRVALQFTHRVVAGLIALGVLVYGHLLSRHKTIAMPLRAASVLLVGLIAAQVTLGAQIIWTGRSIVMTTGHVVLGAFTLATTFLVVFLTRRDTVEGNSP